MFLPCSIAHVEHQTAALMGRGQAMLLFSSRLFSRSLCCSETGKIVGQPRNWAAASWGVTNGGLRGVWPPFLEIGLFRV